MIRVYVGTEPKTALADQVLEFSIRQRTKEEVEFIRMDGPGWEQPPVKLGTGFSLRRLMIPEKTGYEGRAIYLDADQLVLGDIRDLWKAPDRIPGPSCAWTTWQPDKARPKPAPQSSAMVIDCALAKTQGWSMALLMPLLDVPEPRYKEAYARLMHLEWLYPSPQKLPVEWNHLNVFLPGQTKLLHHTKEPEQPWYKPDHPLAPLWRAELKLAIAAGAVRRETFDEALAMWSAPKQDWRPKQGLHPHYAPLRELFPKG